MRTKSIRTLLCSAFCLIAAGVSTSALATATTIVPASSIQVTTYGLVAPVLFYTGSVCSNQHLNLDASASTDVQKLLWAAVLSAKSTGAKLSFDYDFNGDACIIRSFSVMAN
jgi:hypothetical protein